MSISLVLNKYMENLKILRGEVDVGHKGKLGCLPSKLNPFYVTGFSDGEACFHLAIGVNPRYKIGYYVNPGFIISIHKKDEELLRRIQAFFGGIGVISPQNKESVQYRVGSLKDLNDKIIPHFDKYPLISKKQADFILFKKIINLLNNKEHLTIEGLQKILCIKGSLNLGLSDELKTKFPNIKPIARPIVALPEIIEGN